MASKWTYHGGGVCSKVRSDGKQVFYIQYRRHGRKITEKVGLDEQRARGRIEARREAMEDPAYIPEPIKRKAAAKDLLKRITFDKFAKEFMTNHGETKRSNKTFFRPMTSRMTKEFGSIYVDEITTPRLRKFIIARTGKVGPGTVNQDIRFLKNMFNRAVEWGYIKASPATAIKQLQEPQARELFLSQIESNILLEVAQAHVRPVVQFDLLTGMRRSEILGLSWDDVNLDRRTIRVWRTSRDPKQTKNGKARVLPIGDDLHALLKALPRHVKTSNVFTYYGRPIKSLQGSWEKTRASLVAVVAKSDEDRAAVLEGLHFHDIRHTWASRMVMKGVDLYTLMDLGGWSDLAMVKRYAHFSPEYKLKAAQLLNGTAQVGAVVGGQSSHSSNIADVA